ncbi:MAG: TRAP transporter small permease [Burkholderiaceae bacterium]|nr:TRAP transporter small permease [Burkholderiaceae bacterium]MCD6674248.1 TRAP transporter small permease [Burkholderiaceae bacterium]
MTSLFAWSQRIGSALARLAQVLLGAIVLLVSADVLMRNFGQSLVWSASFVEYLLVYVTFLPMPALVRGKAHVCADFARRALPAPLRALVERAIYAICVAICLYLGLVAFESLVETARSGAYEVRTFDMPRWLVYLPMVIGLWLSSIEFLRYLLGLDSLYDGDPTQAEGF